MCVDEARPVCRRCTTARIECMGYRDTTFISFEAGDAGPRRFGSNTSELRTLRVIHRTTQPSPTLFIPCPPDDNMCISYARMHLPTTWQEEVHWQVHESKNVAKKPELEDNLPQCALISLARVLFAQRFQQADLLQKGLSLYSQVLSAVNKALGQPDCGQRLEVLDAVVALRAFDVSFRTPQLYWNMTQNMLQWEGAIFRQTRSDTYVSRSSYFVIIRFSPSPPYSLTVLIVIHPIQPKCVGTTFSWNRETA